MKRSKAIKEIHSILKTWEGSKLEKKCAKEILDKLEELGMMPPAIIIDSNGLNTNGTTFVIYDWEE